MNKTTIGILSFVGGAVIGGITTFFITKKQIQKQAEIYIQTQLEEDRKSLREKYDDIITEKKEEIENDAIDEYCEEVRKQRREYREAAKKYNTTDESIFHPFDIEDEEVKEALKKSRVSDINDPYIISDDEHRDGEYDTKLLFYHPDAYDVADESGVLVDPSEYIGSKLFNEFADDENIDELLVRNDSLKLDISIIKEVVSR